MASRPEVLGVGRSWERLPVALYRTSPEGRILDVNDACVELLGCPSRDSLMQVDVRTLYADPKAREHWRSTLESEGVLRDFEAQLRRSDGSPFWARNVAHAVRDETGKTVYYEGVLLRVNERAEQDARRLTRAVEQAAESIVITDPEGTIVYVNPAFERLTGYDARTAVGQNPRLLKSGRQDDAFYRAMWDALARGEVWKGNLVNRRKDGTLFEEEATIAPVFDASRRLVNYVAVKRDVTNEVELERRLSHAERMEAVGRLAGGVAHDFNNLLGVIMGYVGLALRETPAESPAHEKLNQTLKAAERAAGLTRQLLAFSRKQVLQPTVLDLNALVRDTQPMLRHLLREDIELVTKLAPRPATVKADPGQIQQILLNLAANARDAMPDGGQLTIETGSTDLDPSYAATRPPVTPGRYVMLALSDTGQGMDAETQAHLFEPFFTTKALGKGTGLGLATVYGVVRQSGGHISVYSEPGVGTTFKIYLPQLDADAASERRPEPAPAHGGAETVLVVEDEPMLRDMLRETLQAHGHRVLVARDGTEALQIADEQTAAIQLLVSDVIMPGFTGLQLAEQLARGRPETKVLFISGYTDGASLQRGMPGPGPAFLSKPFGPEAFLRKVREVLDGAAQHA